MLFDIFYTANFLTDIFTDILGFVSDGLSWVGQQADWMQVALYAAAALLILIGLFTLLKKIIKFVLVVAILGGVVYLLDAAEIINIQSILDSITGLI